MIKSPLENVNGTLYVDGVSTLKLAEEFGTPLYVMSEKKIMENYRRLREAFSRNYAKVRLLYSAKANTNISILRILKSEGAGLDVVSAGEVFLALEAGFPASEILYTGTSVADDELKYLFDKKVMINIDAFSQLKSLLRMGTPSVMSVRINPEVGSGHHENVVTAGKAVKFGIRKGEALEAYRLAKMAGVETFGIHMHIGSGWDADPFLLAAEKLFEIAKSIHETVGIDFNFIDFGGGIKVPYKPEEKEVDLETFSSKLTGFFKEKIAECSLGTPEFWLEPGRYMVAEAGILLTRVNTLKSIGPKRFAGVDAGFNTLVRPAMYGSYHHILVANKLNELLTGKYDVVGPICESGDALARERMLPNLSERDLLAVLNAGAYGFSMSSQYNSRPRPAEVLVNDGEYELIRERETLQDLVKSQKIAGWLKR